MLERKMKHMGDIMSFAFNEAQDALWIFFKITLDNTSIRFCGAHEAVVLLRRQIFSFSIR